MNKKRLLHVLPSSVGGVNTILREIISGTADNYDITVFIVCGCKNVDKLVEEKIQIVRLNQKHFLSFRMIWELICLIKKNDIIHVHLFPTFYLCAILKPFFAKKTFIYTEHASVNNRRKYNILRYIEIPIYKLYNDVIAVSDSCKINLEIWLRYKVHVQTINNGIDVKKYDSQFRFDFESVGIDAQYVVTMVARLSTDKDFYTIIRAMSLLSSDYHLVFVGDGDLRSQIEDEIRGLSLTDKITLLGYRIDVAEILASSTLSVLSTYAEGMGLVILESLAVGIPCIGSDVEGVRDVLPDSYRFERGNIAELAALIERVVENKIEVLPYNDILKKYSVEKMVSSYRELYNNSLSN